MVVKQFPLVLASLYAYYFLTFFFNNHERITKYRLMQMGDSGVPKPPVYSSIVVFLCNTSFKTVYMIFYRNWKKKKKKKEISPSHSIIRYCNWHWFMHMHSTKHMI